MRYAMGSSKLDELTRAQLENLDTIVGRASIRATWYRWTARRALASPKAQGQG